MKNNLSSQLLIVIATKIMCSNQRRRSNTLAENLRKSQQLYSPRTGLYFSHICIRYTDYLRPSSSPSQGTQVLAGALSQWYHYEYLHDLRNHYTPPQNTQQVYTDRKLLAKTPTCARPVARSTVSLTLLSKTDIGPEASTSPPLLNERPGRASRAVPSLHSDAEVSRTVSTKVPTPSWPEEPNEADGMGRQQTQGLHGVDAFLWS